MICYLGPDATPMWVPDNAAASAAITDGGMAKNPQPKYKPAVYPLRMAQMRITALSWRRP